MTPDDANITRESPASAERAGASVVIATYNGAKRVPEVLAALAAQTAPDGSFEVIVVDNNSTDGTAATVESDPATAALRARGVEVRVVSEPRQGSAYARLRGVAEAARSLICFLDDDNLPEAGFIESGVRLFTDGSIGLAISSVIAKWNSEPPKSILRRKHLLAINDYLGNERRDFGANGSIAPTITAGLWIERRAILDSTALSKSEGLLAGRKGQSLACGEDIELGILVGKAGYRRIYDPTLRIFHNIPASRFETEYMRRLIEGIVRSELTVRQKYFGESIGLRERLIALARLIAAPLIALYRGDAKREAAFIAAAAIARLKGPFRITQ